MRSEDRLRRAESALAEAVIRPDRETVAGMERALGVRIEEPTTLHKLLKRQDLTAEALAGWAPEIFSTLSREERAVLEARVRYEGYIRRELDRVERLRPLESRRIPADFDYELPGLSREVIEKCARRRPGTVGEAGRIPGVTPAAVAVICAHVGRARTRSA
jgi:tRNA uridine 5-carboxymethylaminomethyl modification enzyme